jgi:hypothetical protein
VACTSSTSPRAGAATASKTGRHCTGRVITPHHAPGHQGSHFRSRPRPFCSSARPSASSASLTLRTMGATIETRNSRGGASPPRRPFRVTQRERIRMIQAIPFDSSAIGPITAVILAGPSGEGGCVEVRIANLDDTGASGMRFWRSRPYCAQPFAHSTCVSGSEPARPDAWRYGLLLGDRGPAGRGRCLYCWRKS